MNWLYEATLPCIFRECPHNRQRRNREWARQSEASQCSSATSPHPIRRGSITRQLNIGRSVQDIADRAATLPNVIRRYYDHSDLDEGLPRRVADFDGIDLCQHSDPIDFIEEIDQ